MFVFFFFKQKTAYEMRISDWSSDVCSSDLTGMTAYEIMLSESQERMLMIIRTESEAEARAVFDKWDLDFAVIGEVTETGRIVLPKDGAVQRSEESRVGEECGSRGRYRCEPTH